MIEIASETLKARILPYGATVCGLWHKHISHSLVLGSDDPAAYRNDLAYCGAVVGPVANRVAGASVTLKGRRYVMEANEGSNTLHGGATGTHAQEWSVEAHDPHSLRLRLTLPDGAGGLPGHRHLAAHYAISDNSELIVTLTATSDADTVMNLAHHPYWTLDAEPTVAGHRLQVEARHYLPVDAEKLPTGACLPVSDTPYDFRAARAVPLTQDIDVNLCLSDERSDVPRLAARLTGRTGVSLDLLTTEPGLQVYNGSGLPVSSIGLRDDKRLQPYAGLALEPQAWPDAARHGHFPSIQLQEGDQYRQITVYRIGT